MKVLLIYPEYPSETFWGFKHALKFVRKRAGFPPLGLLTVASMMPDDWEIKLIDMNVKKLCEEDIKWADYVFISAMITQKDSARAVIAQCNWLDVKVVAGGPLFTTGHEEFSGVDHFVLGEVEEIFQQFVKDMQNGCAKRIYSSEKRPEITSTPVPMWKLVNAKHYGSMPLQISRGCPFNCEFCDIVIMNGRVPRLKLPKQVIAELDAIYETGFRGAVFIVDDNFIGNKNKVKPMLLEIAEWQEKKGFPFTFTTEASIDLALDEVLMQLMACAGFNKVFVGLETPSAEGLAECGKRQNSACDMVASVKKIQNCGLEVMGGFIVGFDSDTPSIFADQIKFIQETGVMVAMVGVLNALPKTKLWLRLKEAGRLLSTATSGNNTDASFNFVPKMPREKLIAGYKEIVQAIYSPNNYYKRLCAFLREYRPAKIRRKVRFADVMAFLNSVWYLGLLSDWQTKKYYWKAIFKTLFKHRRAFPEVVIALIYGHHFRRVAKAITKS